MSAHRTAEETQQDSIAAMGEALGRFYHALSNELAWLYLKWGEYVELFGTKPSRIDIMNQAAPEFFRIVQDSLWEDVLLHLARLTDSPKSAGRENLTIRGLPGRIPDANLQQSVEEAIAIAQQKTEFARDWRNRRIAHKDLTLAMMDGAIPLQPASRANVKEALTSISDVLNAVTRSYMGLTTMYDDLGTARGAISLLWTLDDGLSVEEERKQRFKAGEYRADDFKRRDL